MFGDVHRRPRTPQRVARVTRRPLARRPGEGIGMLRRALLLSVAFATFAIVAGGSPVRAAQSSSSGWSVSPSPNPRAGNGLLNAVSCPNPSRCTAVGLHVRSSGLGVTLAEQRD